MNSRLYRPMCCRPWPLSKGARPKQATTNVARYVDDKAPALAAGLTRALQAHSKRIAGLARQHAAPLLHKSDDVERIRRIIDELNLDDLGEDLEGELVEAMLAAFKHAAAIGATQVGFSIENITAQVDKAAVEYAREHGAELIKDLAGTTEDAMQALLERAVDEGMSTDRLADAIEEMGAFGEARAEMIARTELARAHVQGNVRGWRESGEVVGKRWLLADTHEVPDECDEAAAAGVVALDDAFVDDIDFPPAHVLCCCDVLPVLREPGDDEIEPLERSAGARVNLRANLCALLRKAPPEKTTMNFTKELKTAAAPPPTTSLSKMKLKPPPVVHATGSELNEAAGLIKKLHRAGGEVLLKVVTVERPERTSDESKPEKSAAPAPVDGLLDPRVQDRLDREVVVAAVKARLRQPGTAMGWRRTP